MMKRIILLFLLVVSIGIFYSEISKASCPTPHAVQHPSPPTNCVSNVIDGAATGRFWCLSGGAANNNGSNTSWWVQCNVGLWRADGNWANTGVSGCCGMWDTGVSFDSKTMMLVADQNRNPGTVNHQGEYVAQVREPRELELANFILQ